MYNVTPHTTVRFHLHARVTYRDDRMRIFSFQGGFPQQQGLHLSPAGSRICELADEGLSVDEIAAVLCERWREPKDTGIAAISTLFQRLIAAGVLEPT